MFARGALAAGCNPLEKLERQALDVTVHYMKDICIWQDLAAGYMSGKLLLKLEAVAFILANHSAENFSFLEEPCNSRARSLFYHTLARLLFMEDTPAKFKTFVAPLQQVPPVALPSTSILLQLPAMSP